MRNRSLSAIPSTGAANNGAGTPGNPGSVKVQAGRLLIATLFISSTARPAPGQNRSSLARYPAGIGLLTENRTPPGHRNPRRCPPTEEILLALCSSRKKGPMPHWVRFTEGILDYSGMQKGCRIDKSSMKPGTLPAWPIQGTGNSPHNYPPPPTPLQSLSTSRVCANPNAGNSKR